MTRIYCTSNEFVDITSGDMTISIATREDGSVAITLMGDKDCSIRRFAVRKPEVLELSNLEGIGRRAGIR